MDYNYHNHTFRCGHATGTEEEYIKRAIENGIKYIGFSDHMPFCFPDGYESGYRMPTKDAKDYFDTLNALKEKYKDQIDIKIGFEMEFYPKYFDQMQKKALEYGAEYLILGQHFIYNEHPDGIYIYNRDNSEKDLKEYTKCCMEGMASGAFSYLAHPDLCTFYGDEKVYEEEARKICIASRIYDVPLEINFLGIRTHRIYPTPKFWEIAGEERCPVTFGFDAHDTENAYDGESLLVAEEMVKKYNLNYIGRPKLIVPEAIK